MKDHGNKPTEFISPIIRWTLFGLFSFLFIVYQLVEVVPYPQMKQDWMIGSLIFGSTALGFLWLELSAQRKIRQRERLRKGHCPSCDYDLTANVSGRCPECGEAVHARAEETQE